MNVCTHLYGIKNVKDELRRIQDAGYRNVRQDLYWNVTNPKPGRYEFGWYDEFAQALLDLGMGWLAVVCFGNNYLFPSEDDKTPPTSEKAAYQWREWLKIVNVRYRHIADGWEIWNEPNRKEFWKPEPSIKDYLELCADANGILEGKKYIGALSNKVGTAEIDWDWVKGLAVFCQIFDWKLSLHPYKVDAATILKVQDVLSPGQDVEPMFAVTENGWSRAWGGTQPDAVAKIRSEAKANGYETWDYCWDNPQATSAVEKGFSLKPTRAV